MRALVRSLNPGGAEYSDAQLPSIPAFAGPLRVTDLLAQVVASFGASVRWRQLCVASYLLLFLLFGTTMPMKLAWKAEVQLLRYQLTDVGF